MTARAFIWSAAICGFSFLLPGIRAFLAWADRNPEQMFWGCIGGIILVAWIGIAVDDARC